MKKILIVVDMQNDFITGPLGNEDCRNAVKGCVDLCKSGDFNHIIFTRDTHQENYMDTLEGKKLPVKHCINDTAGWNIIPELDKFAGRPESVVIDKDTFGSVSRNPRKTTVADNVRYFLKEWNDNDVELHFCGVCSSICVLSNMTILRAYFPNTKIVLHRNATGDVTEEMKQAAFICAKAIQCEVED